MVRAANPEWKTKSKTWINSLKECPRARAGKVLKARVPGNNLRVVANKAVLRDQVPSNPPRETMARRINQGA